MKKFTKRLVAIVSLSTLLSLSLVGCAKKTECSNCHEVKKCYEYEATALGMSECDWLCDDCADEIEAGVKLLGGTFKKK